MTSSGASAAGPTLRAHSLVCPSDTLPSYPGYALGSLIKREELLLPLYQKQLAALHEELCGLELKKSTSMRQAKSADASEKQRQSDVTQLGVSILRVQNQIVSVSKKIDLLVQALQTVEIQEALPLDERSVQLINDNRAFKQARIDHLTFSTNENILDRLQDFVAKLFLQDAPLTTLPRGTLEAMAEKIASTLQNSSSIKIAVVGAFVTLERVRRITPLIIQNGTLLSSELLHNSDQYYILNEAVLGAFLLAMGKEITTSEPAPETNRKDFLTTMATISFISQGVIPKHDRDLSKINLWTTYVDWVETLKEDPYGGYPIGFKVRSLTSVLQENRLLPLS